MADDSGRHGLPIDSAASDGGLVSVLIDSLPEIFCLFDADGHPLRWNHRLEEVGGYTADEIGRLHAVEFFPAEQRDMLRDALERAFTDGVAQVEGHLLTGDGRRLPHLFSLSRVVLEGRPLVAGCGIDIAERERWEARLRASEAHYRALIEQSITGVYVIRDGLFTYVNHRLAEIFGYAEKDIVGTLGPADLIVPEDRDRVREHIRRRMAGEVQSAHYVARGLRHDGGGVWLEIHGSRVDSGEGPMITGTLLDITQRKEAEDALRESQRVLETLVGNLPGVVYRCANDRNWTMRFISDYARELLGYTAAELLAPESPTFGELSHPDDRARIWDTVQEAVSARRPFRLTFRVRHRDQGYRWVWEQGRAIYGTEGEVLGLEGFITDITEYKHAEDEVRRLAERLTTTLESITDAFYTLDREWRFTYMNREAERVLGRSREELVGRPIGDELPGFRGATLEEEFTRAMRDDRSTDFEYFWPEADVWQEYHVYPSQEGLAVYFRDVTQRKRDQERIEFLALYDPLTHLPNRRLLSDRLEHALAVSRRRGSHGAILFLDVDDFKSVNDAFGHDTGDGLLQAVASRLLQCLRRNDTVARFAGDEFAVVIDDLPADPDAASEEAAAVGQKILDALSRPFRQGNQDHHHSASIGIALFGHDGEGVDELMKRADLAMYRAKDSGRNTVRMFDPSMQVAVTTRVQLEADLREALEAGTITVAYQPLVDADDRLTGAEALARWSHPVRGPVSPAEFIPVAEHTGLILALGRAVLASVCNQLAAWSRQPETAGIFVAANVSARQFHHPDFASEVLGALDAAGADPGRLRIEITESALLDDIEDTTAKITALKAHGVGFSLDDFGTGYSSLSYLKNLPLDGLKIDQSFVRDMASDPNDAAIVRAVIAIAHSLHLGVTAEGVETDEVRRLLAASGCIDYQGFLFGASMTVPEFEAFARARSGTPGGAGRGVR